MADRIVLNPVSYHGHGAIENIVPELERRGCKKALVATDPDLLKFGVAKKVNMLAHSIARGISQGVLPLIAYSYASRNYGRMKKTIAISEITEVSVALLCTVISLAFAPQLVGIFIDSGVPSHGFGTAFLRILCIGGPFSACAYGFISFFQATGHAFTSLMLALMRKGILDIPLMFALSSVIPVYGIVWATPAADMLCCITAIGFFVIFLRRIKERDDL